MKKYAKKTLIYWISQWILISLKNESVLWLTFSDDGPLTHFPVSPSKRHWWKGHSMQSPITLPPAVTSAPKCWKRILWKIRYVPTYFMTYSKTKFVFRYRTICVSDMSFSRFQTTKDGKILSKSSHTYYSATNQLKRSDKFEFMYDSK